MYKFYYVEKIIVENFNLKQPIFVDKAIIYLQLLFYKKYNNLKF